MSLTKYEILLKTAECGSFTRAAQELNFTQSGISHAVSSLEAELGTTLVVRSHGGVSLTADGRALLPYFREMCALQHQLEQKAADLRGLDTGLVRVATFTSVSEKWMPYILKSFQEIYPKIEFELLPSNFNNEIADWVTHGQADCGFVSLPTEKHLDSWLLQRDQWKVIVPCDHPLAGRDPFPPEALEQYPVILLDEGDEVIVPEPFYPNYHTFITTAGGVIHPLHTKPEEGYFYADRARIEACITPKTKAIMITNPGNPTGTCLTEAQMKMLLDVAVAHDLYLVADEVYREFTYDGEPLHSFGKFDYGQENLILIDSVSKRFSACGARIGCLISRNREFMANALKYCQARLSVATLDQIAAAALYSVGPEYFEQVRQEYKRRRDTVVRKLHEIPGVICECPRGAFYLMAALPVDDAEKFQLWLLQEFEDHGDTVMFSAGEPFYATPGKGRNEIRIAYVLKQEDLERAMDLLALGIRKYNETH